MTIDGQQLSLIIWDIEGNTSIEKARNSYLIGTQGFIYVFDITRPETYENLESEINYLTENHTNIPFCLVGNKSDLFTNEFSQSFFKDKIYEDCHFTSAKSGNNVESLFLDIATKML